jgi:hypothetical protein
MNFSPLKITQLATAIKNTALRFPFIIVLMALAACFALINLWSINENVSNQSFEGFRWAIILGAGLPLYVAYFIWNENQSFSNRLANGGLFALTLAIHFYIGQHIFHLNAETTNENEPFWLLSWLIIIHLYPTILPFFKARNLKDFWSFNHWMFNNFIASSFYILLIYAGIELALGGIQLLIFEDLSWKVHISFLILLIGIFHPIFFLSSAPTSEQQEIESGNLLALQRIQQWILSPLVVIYLTILYVYFAKIIFQQSLPKGWVSIWILLFSIIGLLNWLLARPFVSSESNQWGVTSRRFFLYLLPLTGLLWWAILYRLLEYGTTETRTIVVFLAVFLTAIALIFYWLPKTQIAIIPGILIIITLLYINGGPVSASQLSFHSQMNQWNKIKAQPQDYTAEHTEDVLRYLSDHHPENVSEYCINCDSISIAEVNQYNWASEQIQGCTWTFAQDSTEFIENEFTQLNIQDDGPVPIAGYSEIIPINRNNGMEDNVFSNGYSAIIIADVVSDPDHQNEKLQISIRDYSGKQESFFFGQLLENIITKWEKKQQPSIREISDKIVFDFNFQGKSFRFVSDYINYETTTLRIDAISGYLMMN